MVTLTEVRYDDDGQSTCGSGRRILKVFRAKGNLRRIAAEQDHTLNLHQKIQGWKADVTKGSQGNRIGSLCVCPFPGHGSASKHGTPNPRIPGFAQRHGEKCAALPHWNSTASKQRCSSVSMTADRAWGPASTAPEWRFTRFVCDGS